MSKYARAAPAVFPLPFHRTLEEVDAEKRNLSPLSKARAARKALRVARMFSIQEAGQKGVCTADPALTNNAFEVRLAMAVPNAPLGELQPGDAA